jgi:hypothetical protein
VVGEATDGPDWQADATSTTPAASVANDFAIP